MERPDLSGVDPAVSNYIEALEGQVQRLRGGASVDEEEPARAPIEPCEPPTTLNVITITAAGVAKRTPRHLYQRQRRGGTGVLDVYVSDSNVPAFLLVADEASELLLVTSMARIFRLPVAQLPATVVHARGQPFLGPLGLYTGERLVSVLPAQRSTYAALLSERGWVICLPAHLWGQNLRSSTVFYDVQKHGLPTAACWARSDQDLFLVSRHGLAVRLGLKKVPSQGCLGIRLDPGDAAVALTAVAPDGGVFLLGADGRATIRSMSGFGAFKAPGAGGKAALKTECLVAAASVSAGDDLFIVSKGGKMIRFAASEVPPKEGVVQGVACMALRADEAVAAAVSACADPGDRATANVSQASPPSPTDAGAEP